MTYTIHAGSNLDILPTLPDNSVDSIVTDPPYELGFMGKKWDNSGIAYSVELWTECLRVLKPGGHLLSFGGTRTWHRVAVAIEDAGFEVRDSIAWMYGSGFPKSLDVSKAINKTAGVEYEAKPASGVGFMNSSDDGYNTTLNQLSQVGESTPEAEQWQGWGTALKPAFEPIVVARKPLIGTVAANVLEHGTGALNIDGSRIEGNKPSKPQPSLRPNGEDSGHALGSGGGRNGEMSNNAQGRWPANVILDEYSAGELDEQSGISKDTARIAPPGGKTFGGSEMKAQLGVHYGDRGGASRFFYCAKASKRDRNEGLEGLPETEAQTTSMAGKGMPLRQDGSERREPTKQNFHPTVKPTNLMRYLVKLVTPPNGTVLDPFTGSGSTGKAAILEGFDFIGIELTEEYLPIIEGRLKHAEKVANEDKGLF